MGDETFFQDLPALTVFSDVPDPSLYQQAPDSWCLVITDVQGSTKAIEAGRYKDVNALGVASIVAVRMGAYTLAVSGIIGGNAFDTLFLAAADVGYLQGSIYHAAGTRDMFMVTLALAMTAVLSAGLIARQKSGPGNIGWEGISLILLYLLLIGSRLV